MHPKTCSELILIVDDSPTQKELLRYIIEDNNFEVMAAGSGREALALMNERKPSLVISDVVMPEMSGYELCRQIKADESTMDIPVILLTALSSSDDVLEGLACGADNFLTKPYGEDYLINLIRHTIESKTLLSDREQKAEMEILFHGKKRRLSVGHRQMFTLLISAYETAIRKNTQLIASEEKFRSLNESLEELILQRTSELTKANIQKDMFFSIIAHDLRSPFTGFLGPLEMMAHGEEELSKAELIAFSKSMFSSASNLYELLENLLEWAQMQKNAIEFSPDEINLHSITHQCIETVRHKATQKGVVIRNYVGKVQSIFADEKMLGTVLRNLLSNAVKFTRRNGEVTVQAATAPESGMVEVSVTDTGVGMSEDTIRNLFRIEEKVGSKGTEGELSTGLGLLLCKEFVEKHGGTIRVESIADRGSIFSFVYR